MTNDTKSPKVVSVIALDGCDEAALLAMAAGLARSLEVPLAAANERFGDWPERLRQRGERVLVIAVDGRPVGLVGLIDDVTDERSTDI